MGQNGNRHTWAQIVSKYNLTFYFSWDPIFVFNQPVVKENRILFDRRRYMRVANFAASHYHHLFTYLNRNISDVTTNKCINTSLLSCKLNNPFEWRHQYLARIGEFSFIPHSRRGAISLKNWDLAAVQINIPARNIHRWAVWLPCIKYLTFCSPDVILNYPRKTFVRMHKYWTFDFYLV